MASTPKPPDPFKQAAAQEGADRTASMTSSIMNNPNQVNPYGSMNYSIAGYETVYDTNGKPQQIPRYTQTTTLSPDQQRLLGLQTQGQYNLGQTAVEQTSKLRDYLGKGVDTKGMQGWQNAQTAGDVRQDQGATDRPAIEKAMMARYQENAAKQNKAQDAQLAARGMSPGSSQYSTVDDTRQRALTDASQQAYLASGDEARAAQAAYNQAQQQRMSMAQFNNQTRQNQLAELLQLRNQPLNEISALMSGSQVTGSPYAQYQGQGVNAAPIGSYIGQNYQMASQNAAAKNAGIFNLAGAGVTGLFGMA